VAEAVHSSSAILEAVHSPFQNHPEHPLEGPTPGPAAVAAKMSLHIQGKDIIDGVYLVTQHDIIRRTHTHTLTRAHGIKGKRAYSK
jgi:hypothetical protein